MLAWLWLTQPDGFPRGDSVLAAVLFGFALPGVVAWIPLTVASPFFCSASIRRLTAFFAAGLVVTLALGRHLAMRSVFLENDLLFATGLGGALHLFAIHFTALESHWNPDLFRRRGTVALSCWIGGSAVAGAIASITRPIAGLAFAALVLAVAGILPPNIPNSNRSPWLLAERSLGRLARLADLLRTERKARRHLVIFGSLFGVTVASLAWLSHFFPPFLSKNTESDLQLYHLSTAAGCLLLGFGCGALRFFSREEKLPQPGRLLSLSLAGSFGALVLLSMDPITAVPLTFLPGFALGLMGRLCRESLLDALDRKGARLPRETEAAVGTCLCLGLLVIGGLSAILEKTITSQWPALVLLTAGWGALAYFSWRIRGSEPESAGEKESDPWHPRASWLPDTWAPGFAPKPDGAPVSDGRAVTIHYVVPEKDVEAFREAIATAGRARRRTGALQWRLASDLENPGRFTESYVLESWSDYQEALRHESPADRAAKQRVFDLNDWESLPEEEHEMLEDI